MRNYYPIEPKNTVTIHSVGKAAKYILIGFLLIILSMSAFSDTANDPKATIGISNSSPNSTESITNVDMDRLIHELNPESTMNQDESTREKNETPICVKPQSHTQIILHSNTLSSYL